MVLTREVKTVLDTMGDPTDLVRELEQFRRDVRVFSSRRARLVQRYPEEWVAVYSGKVKAHAKSLMSLLEEVDRQRLPRQHIAIRFIDTSGRKLIL